MEIIIGKYTQAIVHTAGELEPYARAQLQMLCDNECLSGSRIRVMPDVHPGKVGTIGLTMTVSERHLNGSSPTTRSWAAWRLHSR